MTSKIFHVALLVKSELFIIAGALHMVASQIGHLAEAMATANRHDDASRGPGRSEFAGPTTHPARTGRTHGDALVIPMPRRASMQGGSASTA
jgi:hypothetical protein